MMRFLFFILLFIVVYSESCAYTLIHGHPRIWLTPDDLPVVRSRVDTGGAHNTRYNGLVDWCNMHINDSLSSSFDFTEHIPKYAIAHILDPEGNDTIYGDRVVTLLNYLADNGQGWSGDKWNEGTDRSSSDNDMWWEVPAVLAIAYDWVFDRIAGAGDEADIERYLHAILETDCCTSSWSGNGCDSYQQDTGTTHKTEEAWGYITLALAIAGEQAAPENGRVTTLLERAEEFLLTATADYTGSYLREHNHARANGYFIVSNGYESDIANSLNYVAAWHTATTDNLTRYTWWTLNARGMLAILPPGGQFPKIGEVQPYGSRYPLSDYERGNGVIWYLAGAYFNSSTDSGGLYNAIEDINGARAGDDWVDVLKLLWTTGMEDFTKLDRAYHFDRHGGFAFRSGWNFTTSTDIVGEIRGFKPHGIGHYANSSGHFDLRRGGDYLLLKAGAYTGAQWNVPASNDYDQDSDSGNIIHIDDAEQRFRPSSFSKTAMAEDEYGQTTRFQYVDGDYVYGLYDATNGYLPADVNHDAGHVKRSLAFLNDQYIFIHDSISKADAADSVRTLWHMDGEPADDGSGWTDSGQTPSASGRTSTDSTVFDFVEGSSRCWVRLVEPATGVSFTKRGGSWATAFVDIDGTNFNPESYTYDRYGIWTVETKIPNPGETDLDFLYVIQAKASGAAESPVEPLTGNGYIGACVRDSVISAALFSSDGSDQEGVDFSVSDTTGTLKAVVANLTPGTYTVNGTGSYVVDSNGVLFFTADLSVANSFTIAKSRPFPDSPNNLRIRR